jgi:predicted MFS family arabinose efflux permease
VVAGALALGAAVLVLFLLTAGRSLPAVVCWLVAWGLSAGPIYVGLTRACVGDADAADRGMATALFESTTHVSGAIAIALFLSLLEAGAGYGFVYLLAAAAAVLGSLVTVAVMPRDR